MSTIDLITISWVFRFSLAAVVRSWNVLDAIAPDNREASRPSSLKISTATDFLAYSLEYVVRTDDLHDVSTSVFPVFPHLGALNNVRKRQRQLEAALHRDAVFRIQYVHRPIPDHATEAKDLCLVMLGRFRVSVLYNTGDICCALSVL